MIMMIMIMIIRMIMIDYDDYQIGHDDDIDQPTLVMTQALLTAF